MAEENNFYYQPLEISEVEGHGFWRTVNAMRLPKSSQPDSIQDPFSLGDDDARLAGKLIRGGNDHAKCFRGIIVWMRLKFQAGFLIQWETYRHGVECLSTSSAMHGELKLLSGYELAEQKQRDISRKIYIRDLHISYQALRSMYRARRLHRHPDWRIMCNFIETLPYFDKLIFPEFNGEKCELYEDNRS